ncbi:Cysteine desulfurase [Labilithrix luteola]|uniref:Cysteine desulfurase n=1 Tax=Labilithrix luteola TaxID=1391654 RepID=A0A0K1Q6G6_9BACT|nr:aminotransferase class V-fold PLP-dependent enzyme [Labilithrix luteola]AKV01010.1 Cysteine desulfurase [Labilithrix luteola]
MAGRILPSQRHLFDIPNDVAYLNCAYMSPLATTVVEAVQKGAAAKARPWELSPKDFFTDSEEVRGLVATLVNARADDVAFVPAVSYGMAVAAHALPLGPGRRVVTLAEQFPSNVYPWVEKACAVNAIHTTVPRPSDDDWTAAVLEHIDDATDVVAVPHCHWTDGGLLDLVAIRAACDRVGAALCIDATQSLGALPFDVKAIRPDFLCAAGYKWMMGPYSLGYLYVDPRWHGAAPIEHNWIARVDSQNFSGLVDYKSDFQPGARRFDVGERSNFALMPGAKAALRLLLEWGVDNTATTLTTYTTRIAERARVEFGLGSAPLAKRAGHFLGLRFDTGVPDGLLPALAARNVYVSVRGQSMRVTPHLYNTIEDLDRLFACLNEWRAA